MSEDDQIEAVVLHGPEGEVYAVPVEHLEQYRLSDDAAGGLGDEVSGFGSWGANMSQGTGAYGVAWLPMGSWTHQWSQPATRGGRIQWSGGGGTGEV